jgi:hypothetical protein
MESQEASTTEQPIQEHLDTTGTTPGPLNYAIKLRTAFCGVYVYNSDDKGKVC